MSEVGSTPPDAIEDEVARFASVASHDLRNGLATLRGFLDLIVEEQPDLGELSSHLLQRAFDVTDRMGLLVDAIGEHGRARRRELNPEPVSVADVLTALVGRRRDELDDLGATVDVADLPRVVVDDQALADVLGRLLDNCLRYRRGEARPRVVVHGGQDGDRAWFCVDDDGPGLPPGTETAVFETFSKTLNSRGHHTAGLGLATARVLVERSGGTIRAQTIDAEAGGTRITVELPSA